MRACVDHMLHTCACTSINRNYLQEPCAMHMLHYAQLHHITPLYTNRIIAVEPLRLQTLVG